MIEMIGEQKGGINMCINCVGLHPDQQITKDFLRQRMANPQRSVVSQLNVLDSRKYLYVNKSCVLCGRTYDKEGELDDTWNLTAKRVKQEFDSAGITGVSDKNVELTVAKCRKSFNYLIQNRRYIPIKQWQLLTFSGQLTMIITAAQEARSGNKKLLNRLSANDKKLKKLGVEKV